MELWIRSQDRMTLCKCNNIYIDDEWVSPYYIKDDTLTLGKYSTKERALEVLDEIQKLLTIQRVSIPAHNCNNIEHIYKDEIINYVYEIPKE